MAQPWKCGAFIFGILVFVGIITVLLVLLGNNYKEQRKGFKRKRPLPEDGPTIHYYPTFDKSSVIWRKKDWIDKPFIEYNERDDNFLVKEANIITIRIVLHYDISRLPRDSIGAACILLSDGRKKCKADVFLEGSRGIFHMKDKIYARPGFSFSVRILNRNSVIKTVARNMVAITQSFHSGPDQNSTYTRIP